MRRILNEPTLCLFCQAQLKSLALSARLTCFRLHVYQKSGARLNINRSCPLRHLVFNTFLIPQAQFRPRNIYHLRQPDLRQTSSYVSLLTSGPEDPHIIHEKPTAIVSPARTPINRQYGPRHCPPCRRTPALGKVEDDFSSSGSNFCSTSHPRLPGTKIVDVCLCS